MQRWSCQATSAPDQGPPIADSGHARHDQSDEHDDGWHDPVTGLPRAGRFLEHLDRLLAMAGRSGSIAMLVLEVADFHDLRAQLGEPWSDELLRTIGERLHEAVPEPSLLTRLRDGAFAIVLRELGPEVMPETLATHLLERASAPCPGGHRLMRWSLVGALALPGDRSETAMGLLDRAVRALAGAKLRATAQAGPNLTLS